MNKRNLLLLAIIAALGLAACQKQQNDVPTTTQNSSDSGSEVLPDAPIEDKSTVTVDVSKKEQGNSSIGDAAMQGEKELQEALVAESLSEESVSKKPSSDFMELEKPVLEEPKLQENEVENALPKLHPESETTAAEVGAEIVETLEEDVIDPEAKIPVSEQY